MTDLINVYFLVNISSYSTQTLLPLRIFTAYKEGVMHAIKLPQYSIITLIGYIYVMKDKHIIPNVQGKIALTLTILLSMLGVFIGANHVYYFLILMVFIVLAVIFIAKMIEKLKYKKIINVIKYMSPLYLIVIVLLIRKQEEMEKYHMN